MLTCAPSPSLMNWTCLVYGLPMTGAIIWWIVDAHKWFKGPKVNVEHYMLGRQEAVVEGRAHGTESGSSSSGSISKVPRVDDDKKVLDMA